MIEVKNTHILSSMRLALSISLLSCLTFMFSYKLYAQNKKSFTVVLDAGHGGKDPGNRGNNYFEKKIVLNIALKTGELLKKEKGVKVVYTRKSDRYITLNGRANIANKAKADLFVSIHCDAHNSNAYGAGTFVLGLHRNNDNFRIAQKENAVIFLEEDYEKEYDGFDPNNPESVISLVLMQEDYLNQSIEAANYIQQSFVKNLKRKNRTVKQAGFLVLRNTYMPSVLVETGFLTNSKEGAYLNSKRGQNDISRAIANAIMKYKSSLDGTLSTGLVMDDAPKQSVSSSQNPSSSFIYRIQIAASTKNIETKSYNFKGLCPVTRIKKGSLYRYYYGSFSSYKTAEKAVKKAKAKGYKGAYVKAFKNAKEVSITPEMKND
ncbi:MAG: N-acetylmuramoyl-L-alanine amidase AmiA [Bacteroidota bacterium]|nr:MAG: N-acetylmuramoyl-L-alanine amidase AmiA [Bacteroidota bacterium]